MSELHSMAIRLKVDDTKNENANLMVALEWKSGDHQSLKVFIFWGLVSQLQTLRQPIVKKSKVKGHTTVIYYCDPGIIMDNEKYRKEEGCMFSEHKIGYKKKMRKKDVI